ncbi:MAG: nucleotidyltransferase family protein [Betaproteobacteria bacterium]
MNLLDNLHLHRDEVLALAARHRAGNVRLFGSLARGDATPASDIDLLVDPLPGATLFDLGGLQVELQQLLGAPVDLLTPDDMPEALRPTILSAAIRL